MYRSFLTFAVLLACGCTPRVQTAPSTVFAPPEDEHVCCIVFDLSGSFTQHMIDGGAAYEFALQVIDRYFRDRIGTRDKIVIAQISAADRFLLWHGTPQELRQQFPSADDFRTFLSQHADPAGSRVFDGVSQAVRYVLTEPAVVAGAKPAVFVLSDLLDTSPDVEECLNRTKDALKELGEKDGTIGFYYVAHDLVSDWRAWLQTTGVRHSVVTSEIVATPELPSWDL